MNKKLITLIDPELPINPNVGQGIVTLSKEEIAKMFGNKKMKPKGGIRPGAGRKPGGRVRVTIYVKSEILARWNALKGMLPLGEFFEKILGNIRKKDE